MTCFLCGSELIICSCTIADYDEADAARDEAATAAALDKIEQYVYDTQARAR